MQKNEEMRIIRMRGRLQQEQPYYVYIRKELRGAGGNDLLYYTVYDYLCGGRSWSPVCLDEAGAKNGGFLRKRIRGAGRGRTTGVGRMGQERISISSFRHYPRLMQRIWSGYKRSLSQMFRMS